MQPVEFPARDGYVLHGYLTLPVHRPAAQRVPLIALSHGGPRLRDERDFNREVQFYAGLGYGVLQVNYRGSDGFGLAHLQTDIIAVGHISVDDVADGLRWTVAQGYADPKRLVAMGGSYGGYIAMGLATRYPELTAAVVGFAGVYDWRKHIELATYNHATAYAWMSRYFPPVKDREQDYAAISPVTMAAQVRAPVLLLHGESDEVVDIEQSELMRKALLKAGKSVQLVADVANIHGLPKQQSRFDYYRTVTAFLLANAPPDAVP